MARMTAVQKQNTTFTRLLDFHIEALRRNLSLNVSEIAREQKQIENYLVLGSVACGRCKFKLSRKAHLVFKLDHRNCGPHVRDSGYFETVKKYEKQNMSSDKSHSVNSTENVRLRPTEQSHVAKHGHANITEKYLHNAKKNLHGGYSEKNLFTDYKIPTNTHNHVFGDVESADKQRSPVLKRQTLTTAPDYMETVSHNTNLTAFLFSRHCRHGYVMKSTSDPTKESNDYIKSKIRAKVVKNYLLQDVFKRLNSTKFIDFRNKVLDHGVETKIKHDHVMEKKPSFALEQCRYLRVPQKKAGRKLAEAETEDDRLTKIDL